jgi:hypothetical protein
MGCFCSKPQEPSPLFRPYQINELDLLTPISESVKMNSLKNAIDDPVITIESINLSPLAFCLVSGNLSNFIYLLESMNASISAMENLLENQGLNGLDLLIEKGSLEMLQFYLPKYKTLFPGRFFALEESETSCSYPKPCTSRRPPVHIATERGFLTVLQYLNQAVSSAFVPDKYSVHFIDEYSGENCALIACKRCHLDIVKYLNEECAADFNVKSKRNENALLLAASGSKSNPLKAFEVIRYLVEVVGVDVLFQFEELLLILEDLRIVEYVEEQLRIRGVKCSKKDVEDGYCFLNSEKFEFEGTLGAMSSIDGNLTENVSILSIFVDSVCVDN